MYLYLELPQNIFCMQFQNAVSKSWSHSLIFGGSLAFIYCLKYPRAGVYAQTIRAFVGEPQAFLPECVFN